MKWLFTLLVLVNLALLGWGLQRDPNAAVNSPKVRSGIGNLQLLAEVDNPLDQSTKDGVAEASVPEPGEITADPGSGTPEPVPAEEQVAQQEVPAVPTTEVRQESESVANQTLDSSPKTTVIEDQGNPPAEREITMPAAPEPVAPVCGAFGPFERGAEARSLAESLASQGMDTSLRRESMDKPIGYWVMIPPMQNQDEAIEKVKQLRASGIQDIRRFVKGDQKNGISLGVFSNKKNAQSRQQEIVSKGHGASVVPRLITVPTYWVDYRSDQARVNRAVARISESQGAIKNEQYPCSRVVTSGGIF